MIVKAKLAEIQEELADQFEQASLKGQGFSAFLYVVNKGRAVEISEDNGGFWLEFWESERRRRRRGGRGNHGWKQRASG